MRQRRGATVPEPVTQRVATVEDGIAAARTWYYQSTDEKYDLPPLKEQGLRKLLPVAGRARVTCGDAALLVIVENGATAEGKPAAAER